MTKDERATTITVINEYASDLQKSMDQKKLKRASDDELATLLDALKRQWRKFKGANS
jgi:hypothetical protein